MANRPHALVSLLEETYPGSASRNQQNSATAKPTTTQLPTFIPLPVFRYSEASDSEENQPADTPSKPTSRRSTLASLLLLRSKSPKRTRSFETASPRPEIEISSSQTESALNAKRNSLPCSNSLAVDLLNHKRSLYRNSVTGSSSLDSPSQSSPFNGRTSGSIHSTPSKKQQRRMSKEENGAAKRSIRYKNSTGSKTTLSNVTSSNQIVIVPRIINDEGELSQHELDLLHFSAEGNLESLQEIFVQQSYYLFHLDVNCVDSLDRTALSLATLNRHIDVIKFLLSDEVQGLKLGDALFFAIQCEFYEAIELLLDKDPQTALQVPPGTTSPFEPGLTPFMLAAHKNNYKILSMLYRYQHRLTFSDNELLLDEGFDPYSWDAVMERLLHYRARASPAFMLLMYNERGMTWDPLNTAMDLFGELQELARREREVDEAYLQMAERCETLALELLQEVRSASELADFMRYDLEDDEVAPIEDRVNDSMTTESRQKLKNYLKPIEKAVKYEMKDFVTSDNSQLAVIYIQKGSLFRRLKGIKATFVQIVLGLLFPLLSIAFLIAPKSSFGRLMNNPTVKFWCWLASEIVFVFILLTNTLLMQYNVFDGLDAIPPLLLIAYFWILGKFIQELREIFHQGLREYLTDIWNWNDMFTILFYTAFMALRFAHLVTDTGGKRGDGYWREDSLDFLPLSDICIAISYILIHMRIMELLRAERTFGPLQVSLDLMLHDTFRFLIIFAIVFLAFGSGITELYSPYAADNNCTCNNTNDCNVSLPMVDVWKPNQSYFNATNLPPCVSCKKWKKELAKVTSVEGTLYSMFWAVFGYIDVNSFTKLENCPEQQTLVQLAGGIIVGLYHFAAIIVLVNMLIAMMSNSFQKTHDDSEREWKFHRTQLWLKFIRGEINRPPPMNLIPRWKAIKTCCTKIKNLFQNSCWKPCQKTKEGEINYPMRRRTVGMSETTGTLFEGESRYCKVLRLVVLRYVKQKVLNGEMVMD